VEKIINSPIEIEDIKLGKFMAEIVYCGKWDCERCKWERSFLMEEKLKTF
jgi:hypothetical protein